MAYLLIALTAAIVNHHWNEINKYYLDVRYLQAYRVQNNNVADDFRRWLKDHAAQAGTDLAAFFNDPESLEVLQTQQFYKQDFDDVFREAVILLDGIVPKHVNPCPQDFIKRLSIISQTPEALARCGLHSAALEM
jgi:hypothetical protein